MPITYHEHGRYRSLPFVRWLFAANVIFSGLVLGAWQFAVMILLEPLGWAADQAMPSEINLSRMFDYPLVVYWVMPSLAMMCAWLLLKSGNYRAAFGILALPLVVITLSLVMYWATNGNAQHI